MVSVLRFKAAVKFMDVFLQYVALIFGGGALGQIVREIFQARTERRKLTAEEQKNRADHAESLLSLYGDKIDQLWKKDAERDDDLAELRASYSKLYEQNIALLKDNAELQRANAEIKAENVSIKAENFSLHKELDALRQEHIILSDQYQVLVAQMGRMTTQVEANTHQLAGN